MPIISFSVPAMLPSVAMGVMEKGILDFGDRTVDEFWDHVSREAELDPDENIHTFLYRTGRGNKTQTIRPFDFINPNPRSWHSRIKPGEYCDVWWKQRAPKLAFRIGRVKLIAVHNIEIRNFLGSVSAQIRRGRTALPYLSHPKPLDEHSRMDFHENDILDNGNSGALLALAHADGFLTIEDFRDYFVPNDGDVFRGNMLVW